MELRQELLTLAVVAVVVVLVAQVFSLLQQT